MKEQETNLKREKPVTKFCLAKQMAKRTGGRDYAPHFNAAGNRPYTMQRG